MVMCYGEARENGRRALHMYQQQFQNRNHPHHTMFARLYQRLRDDGSLRPRRIGGRPRRHPFSIDDYTELKGKAECRANAKTSQDEYKTKDNHPVPWNGDKSPRTPESNHGSLGSEAHAMDTLRH
ncbi:hypothetical protein ANN_15677 [Periplaneta americana]|uniref:DUF4817 domain-containing protein n=1 Tax=Periplaneta americana TaxID=6978 RepID=A0ABQ8SHF6_PERAM|nr:hypothetical protein ANN_15677 [Periplaneta americana]